MTDLLRHVGLSRRAVVLLTLGYALLAGYHLTMLPIWQDVLAVLSGVMLPLQLSGRVRPLSRGVLLLVTLTAAGAFVVQAIGRFSVETAVAFLSLTAALRVLEIRTRRDVYLFLFVLIYLGAAALLFSTDLLVMLLVLGGIGLALATLVALNDHPLLPQGAGRLLLAASRLVGLAVPLVLVLFLFFPRLGPLWSVPMISGQARTGLSDSVTPGQIADLAQSPARAFRVVAGGQMPPRERLYWRTLVLDHFDGTTWHANEGITRLPLQRRTAPLGSAPGLAADELEILMDPTDRHWAYTLAGATPLDEQLRQTPEGLLRFGAPVDQPQAYRLRLPEPWPRAAASDEPGKFQRYLRLPEGNPRTVALAGSLKEKFPDPAFRAREILKLFATGGYQYTLKPPLLDGHVVDGLLFETRRGFCAHFAGAMTVLLRASGIPARMIAGYQGGEPGADGRYWLVSQFDAHAWVEAWFEGVGWVAFDPTTQVEPDRATEGLRSVLSEEGSFLEDAPFAAARYDNIAVMRWIRLQADLVNYRWQRYVVGYQAGQQSDLLSGWFGPLDVRRLGLITAGAVAVVVAGLVGWSLWTERERAPADPVIRSYLHLLKRIRRAGVSVAPGDSPGTVARALTRHWPSQAEQVETLFAQYARALYDPAMSLLDRKILARALRRAAGSLEWGVAKPDRKPVAS